MIHLLHIVAQTRATIECLNSHSIVGQLNIFGSISRLKGSFTYPSILKVEENRPWDRVQDWLMSHVRGGLLPNLETGHAQPLRDLNYVNYLSCHRLDHNIASQGQNTASW
jgi:hypothetical protein